MTSLRKISISVGLATCLSISGAAAQASVISMTITGTIELGSDPLGIFGTAGANLSGMTFVQNISMQLDDQQILRTGQNWRSLNSAPQGSLFFGDVSVNGHRYNWNLNNTDGQAILQQASSAGLGNYDDAGIILSGTRNVTNSGAAIVVVNYVSSSDIRFNNTLNFEENRSILPGQFNLGGSVFFSADQNGQSSFIYSGQNFTSAQWQVNAVPEPETYAFLLAGLGVMAWMTRRKKMLHSSMSA